MKMTVILVLSNTCSFVPCHLDRFSALRFRIFNLRPGWRRNKRRRMKHRTCNHPKNMMYHTTPLSNWWQLSTEWIKNSPSGGWAAKQRQEGRNFRVIRKTHQLRRMEAPEELNKHRGSDDEVADKPSSESYLWTTEIRSTRTSQNCEDETPTTRPR